MVIPCREDSMQGGFHAGRMWATLGGAEEAAGMGLGNSWASKLGPRPGAGRETWRTKVPTGSSVYAVG